MKEIALIVVTVILSGCGSSGTGNANNRPSPNTVAGDNTNSNLVPYNAGIDPSAFNGNSENMRVVNSGSANRQSTAGTRPVPDNSEFNTTMNGRGEVFETRTFKDHPQILKVERKTAGSEKTLKVYLKNGKVFDVSEEKLPNFMVAAPGNILVAIGVDPTAGRKPNDVPVEKKEARDQHP